jgi:glucoamylase
MENFANEGAMLTEQVWDGPALPEARMQPGAPTGAAMPLCWAHAEYITLVRSAKDGCGFDCMPQVEERYARNKTPNRFEIWTLAHQPPRIQSGKSLRVIADSPATVRWTFDDWKTTNDLETTETPIGLFYVDLPANKLKSGSRVVFTFQWKQKWEGRDFVVEVA